MFYKPKKKQNMERIFRHLLKNKKMLSKKIDAAFKQKHNFSFNRHLLNFLAHCSCFNVDILVHLQIVGTLVQFICPGQVGGYSFAMYIVYVLRVFRENGTTKYVQSTCRYILVVCMRL